MGTRLFVGRLPRSKSEQDLTAMFAPCGTVESARIVLDRETGRPRGTGFVRMSTAAEAEDAITRLDSTEMEGRKLIVRVAKSQIERHGSSLGPDASVETPEA